jgi:amino acid transporter
MPTTPTPDTWTPRRGGPLALLRKLLFGKPLASSVHLEHRLPNSLALPVFASDAVSSVAYGPQEILIVLVAAGLVGRSSHHFLWICLGIAVLMFIVAMSYRRAVLIYPTSGGSYTVAKSNLGHMAGLVAAAALLIDYVLTVAVSVSSGVDALVSAAPGLKHNLNALIAGIPGLKFHAESNANVVIAVVLVILLAYINLRGTKESGWAFALPLYSFALTLGLLIVVAVVQVVTGHYHPYSAQPAAALEMGKNLGGLALAMVLMHAFAQGCSSMTGVEAVSNGVSAFQPPESRNAAKTLVMMVALLIFLFLGTGFAAWMYNVVPAADGHETVLSMLGRATFGGDTLLYYVLQITTLLVLMVAANASFAGFPRLLALVAQDDYAPKAFQTQGDRLVYNRGIIMLSLISLLLIVAFKANVTALIGLYAVGVFLCFTLTQAGMAKRIAHLREKRWVQDLLLNSGGAVITGAVTIIVLYTKWKEGAWMVAVLVPIIIGICLLIKRHYEWFERTMHMNPGDFNPLAVPSEAITVLVLVSSDIHRGILEGLECGRVLAEGHKDSVLRAIHVEMDPEKTVRLRQKWEQYVEPYMGREIRLDIIPSPYRWLTEPIMEYLEQADLERRGDRIIVVLPEFETGSWITQFLHNFTANRLRNLLLSRPRVTVVLSRYFMRAVSWRKGHGGLVY